MKENHSARKIIEKSGHHFHARVINLFREKGWSVLVSPYYSDNFTDKPREIDVIAEKLFDVRAGRDLLGSLNICLFIECKYINNDTIFWFDTKDKDRALGRIMDDTGMEHSHHNLDTRKHHYSDDTLVAKLFSSGKGRGDDNEPISRAINQDLNALVYYRGRDSYIEISASKVLRRVTYPLIVVNSFEKFFRTNIADESGELEPITEPCQLEVNYAYTDKEKSGKNEYFLIDVMNFDKIEEFLLMLESRDINAILNKLIADYIKDWQERGAS